jgi:hypothetical protein
VVSFCYASEIRLRLISLVCGLMSPAGMDVAPLPAGGYAWITWRGRLH